MNNYAKSKLRGEKSLDILKFLILRINFIGHYKKKKLLYWIYKSNNSREKINLYNNIYFSPLHIKTVFEILCKSIKLKKTGIYNFGSNNGISKSKFAKYVIKLKKFKINYEENNYKNKKNPIKRPKNMIMNVKKFEKTFKLKLPNIKKEISRINEKL